MSTSQGQMPAPHASAANTTAPPKPQQQLPKGSPPVILTQHLDAPYRRVLVITAHGIIHLRLPSPLQRLRDYFARSAVMSATTATPFGNSSGLGEDIGDGGGFLSAFLHQFGPQESICAAIAIAASEQGKTEVVAQAERVRHLTQKNLSFFLAHQMFMNLSSRPWSTSQQRLLGSGIHRFSLATPPHRQLAV